MENWVNILVRSISLLILTFVLLRLYGKKNVSKLTPFNFLYLTVIALIAAAISINLIRNAALGLVALAVWFIIPFVLEFGALKSKWIHDAINGKEIVLVKQGKVMEDNLIQARLTVNDLLRAFRSKDAFSVADVEFAVMESDGEINVLLKSQKQPTTPKDLNLNPSPLSEPQTVIMDGNAINESLSNSGFNQLWLNQQLEAMGTSLDNVFLGQVDSSGDLYVDLFDDALEMPKPSMKQLTYANLEKAQAELEMFSLQTENTDSKQMYLRNAIRLKQIIDGVKSYLN